ncbi:MAG: FHA domain-containing protein [Bacteroidetes bacterium]|nr:FHA domain-containing protein [Bacteroidota bacterium]
MLQRISICFLICLLGFCVVSPDAESSIYKVIIYYDGEETSQAMGIWVSENLLLTSESILHWGDQFFIENPETGARYLAEIQSTSKSLALLFAQGLPSSNAPTLSHESPHPNTHVHFPTVDGKDINVLLSYQYLSPTSLTYRFSREIDPYIIGSPLMNRCDQLVSVISGELDSNGNLTGFSESYSLLTSFLKLNGISLTIAPTPCPTIAIQLFQAESLSTSLQQDLVSLERQLIELEDSSTEAINQTAEQLKIIGRQKDSLSAQITEADSMLAIQDSVLTNSVQLQAQLDSLVLLDSLARNQLSTQEENNRRQILVIGGVSFLLILLSVFFLFLFWKRKRAAEVELLDKDDELRKAEGVIEQKSASFSDVLLHGQGLNNNEIRVKIKGDVLAQNDQGMIIGRSSAHSDCVIAEGSVSRQHACITLSGGTLMIEDLNSLNGIMLNGEQLVPGKTYPLSQRSTIVLGDVTLALTILS